MAELKRLKARYEPWEALVTDLEDLQALLELAEEEQDEDMEAEVRNALGSVTVAYEKLRVLDLLGRKPIQPRLSSPYIPVPAAPSPATGPRCFIACTAAGRSRKNSR